MPSSLGRNLPPLTMFSVVVVYATLRCCLVVVWKPCCAYPNLPLERRSLPLLLLLLVLSSSSVSKNKDCNNAAEPSSFLFSNWIEFFGCDDANLSHSLIFVRWWKQEMVDHERPSPTTHVTTISALESYCTIQVVPLFSQTLVVYTRHTQPSSQTRSDRFLQKTVLRIENLSTARGPFSLSVSLSGCHKNK